MLALGLVMVVLPLSAFHTWLDDGNRQGIGRGFVAIVGFVMLLNGIVLTAYAVLQMGVS